MVFLIESVMCLFLTVPWVGMQCVMACDNFMSYSLTFLCFYRNDINEKEIMYIKNPEIC